METPPLTAALESLRISVEGPQRAADNRQASAASESPALAVNSCDQHPSRPPPRVRSGAALTPWTRRVEAKDRPLGASQTSCRPE